MSSIIIPRGKFPTRLTAVGCGAPWRIVSASTGRSSHTSLHHFAFQERRIATLYEKITQEQPEAPQFTFFERLFLQSRLSRLIQSLLAQVSIVVGFILWDKPDTLIWGMAIFYAGYSLFLTLPRFAFCSVSPKQEGTKFNSAMEWSIWGYLSWLQHSIRINPRLDVLPTQMWMRMQIRETPEHPSANGMFNGIDLKLRKKAASIREGQSPPPLPSIRLFVQQLTFSL